MNSSRGNKNLIVSSTLTNGQLRDLMAFAGRTGELQAAEARFRKVYRLARTEGPQLITPQGKSGVVMMSVEQYAQLEARSRQPKSLVQFFRESPLVGLELDFARDSS